MRSWILALAALAVTGIVLVLVTGNTALDAIGVGMAGVAVVGAVSLGFYAVGRSEDRAREAEGQTRREAEPEAERPGDGRISARRPPRSRGDS
jgi:small neutral amino acid transporter SnatA (MarC family)